MLLICPSCKQAMRSVIYHGAKSKFCLACKFFFLRPEQFEQIKQNSDINLDTEAPQTLTNMGIASYNCPACDNSMTRETYGKILKTDIDICDNSNGILLKKQH